jgi:hypothetical protein
VLAAEIVVLFAVVIAANVLIFRARRGRKRGFGAFAPPPPLAPYEFAPGASRSFRGGARVGMVNVTWPGSRLTFDGRRAALRGPHPAVDISRELVTGIGRARSVVFAGVTFDSAEGTYDGVIFWCLHVSEMLAGLRQMGWPTSEP